MKKTTLKQIQRFVSKLKSIQGALVIGSVAYGREKETSDIDLKIVSYDIQDTLNSSILREIDRASGIKELEARSKQECDAHCFKGLYEGRLFSPSIYTPDSFQKITSLKGENLKYVRNKSNGGIEIKLLDFSGHVLRYKIRNEQLSSGYFLAWEPICIENANTTHFGTDPDGLIKSPVICSDNDNWINSQIQEFWNNIYNVIINEHRNIKKMQETGKLPIISERHLPKQVYSYIKGKLKNLDS